MTLAAYCADDLLMGEREVACFGVAIRQQIRLKHLEALWTLLQVSSRRIHCQCSQAALLRALLPQSLTDVDVFAGVLEQYRQELTPAGTAALKQAAPKLELDGLLPALREWILGQLTREGTAADVRGPSLPCLPFPHLAANEPAVLGLRPR